MFELSIKSHMAAAHFLRGYEGKCKNLHGHTWRIEIVLIHDVLDDLGMIADFGILKTKLNTFLSEMDHSLLNDHPSFKEKNPTTENIAKYIYDHYSSMIHPLKVKKVQVWESDTSSVIYYK